MLNAYKILLQKVKASFTLLIPNPGTPITICNCTLYYDDKVLYYKTHCNELVTYNVLLPCAIHNYYIDSNEKL